MKACHIACTVGYGSATVIRAPGNIFSISARYCWLTLDRIYSMSNAATCQQLPRVPETLLTWRASRRSRLPAVPVPGTTILPHQPDPSYYSNAHEYATNLEIVCLLTLMRERSLKLRTRGTWCTIYVPGTRYTIGDHGGNLTISWKQPTSTFIYIRCTNSHLHLSFVGAHLITRPSLQLRESKTNNHGIYDDLLQDGSSFLFPSFFCSLFQLYSVFAFFFSISSRCTFSRLSWLFCTLFRFCFDFCSTMFWFFSPFFCSFFPPRFSSEFFVRTRIYEIRTRSFWNLILLLKITKAHPAPRAISCRRAYTTAQHSDWNTKQWSKQRSFLLVHLFW